ncbi:hypothetical protein Avbf_02567 [Armadillidium vulgare]|nr:hypothetical protein Avbf_02567 [Armadillidium vulgare]
MLVNFPSEIPTRKLNNVHLGDSHFSHLVTFSYIYIYRLVYSIILEYDKTLIILVLGVFKVPVAEIECHFKLALNCIAVVAVSTDSCSHLKLRLLFSSKAMERLHALTLHSPLWGELIPASFVSIMTNVLSGRTTYELSTFVEDSFFHMYLFEMTTFGCVICGIDNL